MRRCKALLNLGILISGRGSNMEAILKALRGNRIPARCSIVISNRRDAPGLDIAAKMGVKTRVIESKGFASGRWEYDGMVADELMRSGVTPENGLVCLAGFMRVVSPQFVTTYQNKILNIHPALLPAFPGLHAQRQAIEYGVKYSGCTVHIVDAGVDTGPILLQDVVPVHESDTAESLAARILEREHLLYPRAIDLFARGKIDIRDRRVLVRRDT